MSAVAKQLSDDDIRRLAEHWSALPAGGAAAAASPAAKAAAASSLMSLPAGFPAGFREYWRAVDEPGKTMQIGHANSAAWRAASEGKKLPDGSIIVIVFHAAARTADGQWVPGAVQSYSGMERQAGWGQAVPDLLRNGNWQYGLFTAQGVSRLGELHPRCLACHKPQAEQSYLFTWPDLRKAASGTR
jgi:Cytochrome P460